MRQGALAERSTGRRLNCCQNDRKNGSDRNKQNENKIIEIKKKKNKEKYYQTRNSKERKEF